MTKDFYKDKKGNLVFTKTFLKNRGNCCKNDCLNCPYKTETYPNEPHENKPEDSKHKKKN